MFTLIWCNRNAVLECYGDIPTILEIYGYLIKNDRNCAIHAYYRGVEMELSSGLHDIVDVKETL